MRYKAILFSLLISILFFSSALAETIAHVETFSPQGKVKNIRQVSVRFSEQMVSFGDLRLPEPFEIRCSAKGTGRWADDKNWVYDFEKDLPAGTACEFILKPDQKTLSGRQIAGTEAVFIFYGRPRYNGIRPV